MGKGYTIDLQTRERQTAHGPRWTASGTVWSQTLMDETDEEGRVTGRIGMTRELLVADYVSTLRKTEEEAVQEVLTALSLQARRIAGGDNG